MYTAFVPVFFLLSVLVLFKNIYIYNVWRRGKHFRQYFYMGTQNGSRPEKC